MTGNTILIADDNQNIRDALTYLLEEEGYEILLANDGADALRKASLSRPDVLILDIMMPEINGYDVCRMIKSNPELRDIHIIMLTAKGQASEHERGKEAGADEYVVKPFSPVDILTRIKKILHK